MHFCVELIIGYYAILIKLKCALVSQQISIFEIIQIDVFRVVREVSVFKKTNGVLKYEQKLN